MYVSLFIVIYAFIQTFEQVGCDMKTNVHGRFEFCVKAILLLIY